MSYRRAIARNKLELNSNRTEAADSSAVTPVQLPYNLTQDTVLLGFGSAPRLRHLPWSGVIFPSRIPTVH